MDKEREIMLYILRWGSMEYDTGDDDEYFQNFYI